jgi:hypothetical protein
MPGIIIEIRKGIATVATKELWMRQHRRKAKAAIDVEIRDYDIEGGECREDVAKRGYSVEITRVRLLGSRQKTSK